MRSFVRIRPKGPSGFTILEIIMVLIIIGILAISASMGFLQAIRGAVFTEKNVQSVVKSDDLKSVAIRISRIYELETLSSTNSSLTCKVLDSEGHILSEIINAPNTMSFHYLDAAKAQTSNASQVRFIVISQNATMGDGTIRNFHLQVAPYHLNYRNSDLDN
jgi:prepilin-type N-terminal cleavage/methylation domain-containing protein